MPQITSELVISILSALGLGGFLVALLTVRPTKKKIRAEALQAGADSAQIVTSTALSLLEPMKKEIEELRGELEVAQKINKETNETLEETKVALKLANEEVDNLRNKVRMLSEELDNYRLLVSEATTHEKSTPPHSDS